MLVYRQSRLGFLETLNTLGGYIPKGWSRSKESALRKKVVSLNSKYCKK